jgi:hypothetical protein
MPVTTAPKPLMQALVFQPAFRCSRQWITMPVCDSVNDTNTPIMYSGSSDCVSPRNATIRTRRRATAQDAVREGEAIALVHELARQVASRETIDASRGKSAYAVFAARTRISVVPACSR